MRLSRKGQAADDPRTRVYNDRQWFTPLEGADYQFLYGAERLLDARMTFFDFAFGVSPSMAEFRPGAAAAYAITLRDSAGNYLDGSRTYRVTDFGKTCGLSPDSRHQPMADLLLIFRVPGQPLTKEPLFVE